MKNLARPRTKRPTFDPAKRPGSVRRRGRRRGARARVFLCRSAEVLRRPIGRVRCRRAGEPSRPPSTSRPAEALRASSGIWHSSSITGHR